MADVNVVVELYGEDEFYPSGIITLTINGTPISTSVTSFGWTTGTLVYAEGIGLAIVVTTSPKYYEDASLNTTAIEGTKMLQLELVNPTIETSWYVKVCGNIPSIWLVGVRPETLGAPISFVDEVPLILTPMHILHKLDEINVDNIMTIDEVFIPDGTWHIYGRSEDIGIDWVVTVTA